MKLIKKPLVFPMKAFFYSIKFRLPGIQNRQSPLSTLLYLNKARYKNKCGGDLSKSPIETCSRSLPQIWCTTSTIQHAEEQDGRNPGRDGRTLGSTKPPQTPFISRFFLLQRWYVQLTPPSNSLSS